jgi:hypothetical protein
MHKYFTSNQHYLYIYLVEIFKEFKNYSLKL